MVKETNTQNKTGSSAGWLINRIINKLKFTVMNKKFLLATLVTLVLGTTGVMAENHRRDDGHQKPQKEVVHKQNKKDKKDKYSKNDRHFDSKDKHHAAKHKPVAHKAPKGKPAAHVHHKSHHKPSHHPVCCKDGRHGKSHYCSRCHHRHNGYCGHVPVGRPVKNHVRITPPFSPIQVTVRI